MSKVGDFLHAVYNFFAGDVILVTAVAAAFIVAALLIHATSLPGVVAGILFVAIIVAGLVTTEAREVAGRPRTR